LIDDMNVRRFSRETQRNYIRDVGRFATFLRRSPDTATADDIRRFQIEQRDLGVPTPTMNSIVSALRFFFTHTIDRPDLARKLIRAVHPRNLPVVLSRDEVARLLGAGPGKLAQTVHLPLMRPAISGAALLVFVDCLKELPATLLLRPLNVETLATYIYQFATRGSFEEGSLAALIIVAIGILPVIRLTRYADLPGKLSNPQP